MYRFAFFIGCFFIIACTKESDEPAFDKIPRIELISISNDTIVEFQESISFVLSYEDGDGDLGHPDPDINSLFVKDSRLENEDAFYVQPLAPVGSNISITGTLNVNLSSTFILGNGNSEQTIFTIYMIDQLGNRSNEIETEPITIIRP